MVFMSMSESVARRASPTQEELGSEGRLSRLWALKNAMKSKKPRFRRQESWRYVRIHEAWRKPKGIDSHMRLSVKGWPPLVKVGYRLPKAVRGLHPSGLKEVLVHNVKELEKISPDKEVARIASTVGKKKRIEIARRAKELGIKLLNARGVLRQVKGEAEEGIKAEAEEKEEEQSIRSEAGENSEPEKVESGLQSQDDEQSQSATEGKS
jgi:large subunit ribosomal protein L32e